MKNDNQNSLIIIGITIIIMLIILNTQVKIENSNNEFSVRLTVFGDEIEEDEESRIDVEHFYFSDEVVEISDRDIKNAILKKGIITLRNTEDDTDTISKTLTHSKDNMYQYNIIIGDDVYTEIVRVSDSGVAKIYSELNRDNPYENLLEEDIDYNNIEFILRTNTNGNWIDMSNGSRHTYVSDSTIVRTSVRDIETFVIKSEDAHTVTYKYFARDLGLVRKDSIDKSNNRVTVYLL